MLRLGYVSIAVAAALLQLGMARAQTPTSSAANSEATNIGELETTYYHNGYHNMLAMSAYGDYNTTCPTQTFTENITLRNFPDTTRQPFVVVNTFGPTLHNCSGYTAVVAAMNKALIVFRGNWAAEQSLSADVVSWESLGIDLDDCENCTANAYAAAGYLECRNETNKWAAIKEQFEGSGLVFSTTGHGLGGMHSLLASVDLNNQNISYYSHQIGAPATFNAPGAAWYNERFQGGASERSVATYDTYVNYFEGNANYTQAGTTFFYSSFNTSAGGPDWVICQYDESDSACEPKETDGVTAKEAHYWYWANVGNCESQYQNTSAADAWFAEMQDFYADLDQTVYLDSAEAAQSSAAIAASASLSSVSAASSASLAVRKTAPPSAALAAAQPSYTSSTQSSGSESTAHGTWLALMISLLVISCSWS